MTSTRRQTRRVTGICGPARTSRWPALSDMARPAPACLASRTSCGSKICFRLLSFIFLTITITLKFFPVFVFFFAVFKLYKAIFSSPPSNSSLFFNFEKKFPTPQGGGKGQNIYPWLDEKWLTVNNIILFITMSYYHNYNYWTGTIFIEYHLSLIIIIWL